MILELEEIFYSSMAGRARKVNIVKLFGFEHVLFKTKASSTWGTVKGHQTKPKQKALRMPSSGTVNLDLSLSLSQIVKIKIYIF